MNFGGSQYLHVAEKIITSDKVSICFWINPVNVSYNKGIMNGRNANNKSFAIYMIGAAIRIDTGTNWSTGYELTANTWTHVAFVSDGTTQKLYINGVLNKNRTATFDYSTIANYFTIGCEHINGGTIGTYFSGKLNDIRIYDDEVLSSKQVANIAKGLILHYPLSGPTEHQVFGDAIEDKATYILRRTLGYNLINNLYAAGRTTVNNKTVTALLSQNLDTYFHFSCSEPLIAGEKYTLSLNCSGFPSSDNYLDWGIIAQNSGKNIRMKNGYCKATFSPNSNIAANSKIIVDDLGRGSSGYQDVTITDIKLEKGEVETPWIEKNSEFDQIVGGSICWNQWGRFTSTWIPSNNNGITYAYTDGTSVKINGTATAVESRSGWFGVAEGGATKNAPGHVFLLNTKLISGTITSGSLKFSLFNSAQKDVGSSIINRLSTATPTANASFRIIHNITNGTVLTNAIVTLNCFDLTLMFGPTIADYILSLENTTAGNGVAWFKKLFPKDYYPYCAPTMKSVTGLISHNTTGFNQFDEVWESGQVNRTTGVNETYSGRSRSKNYIPVLPGATYYFTPLATYFVYYDSNKNCIGTSSGGFISPSTITMPTNAAFVRFTVNTSTPSSYCFNISDYKKNGTYEPYTGRSYALDSNVVLRGVWKLYTNDNNKLYCDGDVYSGDGSIVRNYKQVVLDGTTNKFNGVFGATDNGYCAYISNGLLGTRTWNVICDRFVYSNSSYAAMPLYGFCGSSGASETWSFILPSTVTSLAEANTWLTNNPTTIVVKLATPTTTTATPFSNPQVCSIEGTEEYVIAEQDGVVIPAGHQTKYLHDVLEGRYHTYEEAVSGMGINDNIEYDVSGYKRNGTKTGALKYDENTPKYTYSTKFDGVNAIKLPNFVYTSGIWTVSIWYYYSILPSAYQAILYFGKGDGSDNNKKISISPNSTYIWFKTENNNIQVSNITKDRWVNITLTSDGTTGKIYIDGTYSTSLSITSVLTDCTDLVVGARASASGCATIAIPMNNGMLSDFRFYSTCFSADDVYELYNAGVTT